VVKHGVAPFLECSSRGDKRFSAFYARLRPYGGKCIEEIYQAAKVFDDGETGLTPKLAKEKQKTCKVVNLSEVRVLYSKLWGMYIDRDPILLEVLVNASGLSDMFGQEGHVCQATELFRIRNASMSYS
jgi:hypothetical protein